MPTYNGQVGTVFGFLDGFWLVILVCDRFQPPCVIAVAVISIGSHSPVLPGGPNNPTTFLHVASFLYALATKA
jgi:hypothetical protein